MLVPLNDPLFCPEASCYCNEQASVLTDDKEPSKIYYTCLNATSCGYFILARDLIKCNSCDVYYHSHCSNPICNKQNVWKTNYLDGFLSC